MPAPLGLAFASHSNFDAVGHAQYVWSTIPLVVKLIEQSSGLAPILVIRSTVPPGTTLKWEAEVRAKTDKPFQAREQGNDMFEFDKCQV